ncbi:MAG: hypothetical protein PHH00_00055 [Candidatus Nanoarchaeia archaeon]|nr:hypothetical protein [Candidatus Nanoarchaeia archaeon]
MESLAVFIQKEKDRLRKEEPGNGKGKIRALLSSLLDSMAILPSLFPLYLNAINRKEDFNSRAGFRTGEPYQPASGIGEPEERSGYLVYLGKHIDFTGREILGDIEHDRVIPSQLLYSIQAQKNVAEFYNSLYKNYLARELMQKLPQNVPNIVGRDTLPFFENWLDLLVLGYNFAFHREGLLCGRENAKSLTDSQKISVCREYNLLPEIPFLDQVVTNQDLTERYSEYVSRFGKKEGKKEEAAEPLPAPENKEYRFLSGPLSHLETSLTEVHAAASHRLFSARSDISVKCSLAGERGDYQLVHLIADVRILRNQAALGKLDQNIFRETLLRANGLLMSGLWTKEGRAPILSGSNPQLRLRFSELENAMQEFQVK